MNFDRKTLMDHIATFERHNGRVPNLRELSKSLGLKSSELRTVLARISLDDKTEGTSAFTASLREILVSGQIYKKGTETGDFAAKYFQKNQERETEQSNAQFVVKELKLPYSISSGDYLSKLASIKGFLANGADVRLKVVFKKEEVQYFQLGLDVLARFAFDLDDVAVWRHDPKMVGKTATIVFSPVGRG